MERRRRKVKEAPPQGGVSVPPGILQRGSGAPLDSSAVGYATLESWALEKGAITGSSGGGGGGGSGTGNGATSATLAATMAVAEASEKERGRQSQRQQRRRKVPTLAQYLQVSGVFSLFTFY